MECFRTKSELLFDNRKGGGLKTAFSFDILIIVIADDKTLFVLAFTDPKLFT